MWWIANKKAEFSHCWGGGRLAEDTQNQWWGVASLAEKELGQSCYLLASAPERAADIFLWLLFFCFLQLIPVRSTYVRCMFPVFPCCAVSSELAKLTFLQKPLPGHDLYFCSHPQDFMSWEVPISHHCSIKITSCTALGTRSLLSQNIPGQQTTSSRGKVNV